jgi:DNA-binding XRE family transcriptional regulator
MINLGKIKSSGSDAVISVLPIPSSTAAALNRQRIRWPQLEILPYVRAEARDCLMREDQPKLIGQRLKQLRENLGYTQADLARQLSSSETELAKLEQGKFTLDLLPLLVKLLRLLEGSLLKQCSERKKRF